MDEKRLSQKEFARRLRREPSRAEALLWQGLRNRQIEGHKFVRQEPVGPYVVDFLCRSERLVIEVDGATHGEESELARDKARTAWLEANGYRVIRFQNADIYEAMDWTIGQIVRAFRFDKR
jgi:very-short-patch-repair endonuclease